MVTNYFYLKVTNVRRTAQLSGLLCMLCNLHHRMRQMQCASSCYSLAPQARGRQCANLTGGSLVAARLALDISQNCCTISSLLMNHCHNFSPPSNKGSDVGRVTALVLIGGVQHLRSRHTSSIWIDVKFLCDASTFG
jgi:hypothetical protein